MLNETYLCVMTTLLLLRTTVLLLTTKLLLKRKSMLLVKQTSNNDSIYLYRQNLTLQLSILCRLSCSHNSEEMPARFNTLDAIVTVFGTTVCFLTHLKVPPVNANKTTTNASLVFFVSYYMSNLSCLFFTAQCLPLLFCRAPTPKQHLEA